MQDEGVAAAPKARARVLVVDDEESVSIEAAERVGRLADVGRAVRRVLVDLGCPLLQGYLLGKPARGFVSPTAQ